MTLCISVIILLVVIIIMTIFRNNCNCFSSTPEPSKWNLSKDFNKTNYLLCANLLNYLYELYGTSLKNVISTKEVEKYLLENFDLTDIKLHTVLNNILYYFGENQSLIALTGKIKNSNTGIVLFRGTHNNQEWKSNFATIYEPINIRNFKGEKGVNKVEYFPYVDSSKIKTDVKLAHGWYNLYCRQSIRTKNNCFCQLPVFDGFCKVLPKDFSKIDNDCKSKKGIDKASNNDLMSLGKSIYDSMKSLQVENIIITGHSLGGALATMCAFHLSLAFQPQIIHSVYTFAAPQIGEENFHNLYQTLVYPHYRINNSKDIVGLLTSDLIKQEKEKAPWLPDFNIIPETSVLKSFRSVGIDKTFTITDGSDKGWSEGNYHNLQQDYIEKGSKILFD